MQISASNSAQYGLTLSPSAADLVAIDCKQDGTYAQHVLDALAEQDIFICKLTAPVLERSIRVSVASDCVLNYFEQALARALGMANQ
ncbi:MAG: Aminotransferase class I and II [Candidatus Tokpelaia hoelldobleri]|uniref:Aminotransferase class I and II n=1 Tax=Candidatus Tokpelaia hoelldobleri TaxID=1902579 RepID=A0A1U9JVS3_9HYPH|nr:MAG: Aminotransferase class I and II [Candidatus Tokpelaia hoelldoblerii]